MRGDRPLSAYWSGGVVAEHLRWLRDGGHWDEPKDFTDAPIAKFAAARPRILRGFARKRRCG